jgi:hypothetical protein
VQEALLKGWGRLCNSRPHSQHGSRLPARAATTHARAVWFSTRVVFNPYGFQPVWFSTRMVSNPCGFQPVWFPTRVVFNPCGFQPVWH